MRSFAPFGALKLSRHYHVNFGRRIWSLERLVRVYQVARWAHVSCCQISNAPDLLARYALAVSRCRRGWKWPWMNAWADRKPCAWSSDLNRCICRSGAVSVDVSSRHDGLDIGFGDARVGSRSLRHAVAASRMFSAAVFHRKPADWEVEVQSELFREYDWPERNPINRPCSPIWNTLPIVSIAPRYPARNLGYRRQL